MRRRRGSPDPDHKPAMTRLQNPIQRWLLARWSRAAIAKVPHRTGNWAAGAVRIAGERLPHLPARWAVDHSLHRLWRGRNIVDNADEHSIVGITRAVERLQGDDIIIRGRKCAGPDGGRVSRSQHRAVSASNGYLKDAGNSRWVHSHNLTGQCAQRVFFFSAGRQNTAHRCRSGSRRKMNTLRSRRWYWRRQGS